MNNIDWADKLRDVAVFFPAFLFALCFHEFAHGFVAKLKGDRTAEMMGRLTLNPTVHADPLGTVILPILAVVTNLPLFGWAKPVPVNERNFKNPRKDMFWVAFAGPMSNVFLALVATASLFLYFRVGTGFTSGNGNMVLRFGATFIQLNLILALFNLIPLHPLDGGKVIARFLPEALNRKLEDSQHISSIILMGLFITGAFAIIALPVRYMTAMLLSFAAGV